MVQLLITIGMNESPASAIGHWLAVFLHMDLASLSLDFLTHKTSPIIQTSQKCFNGNTNKWYAENLLQGWIYSKPSMNGNAITIFLLIWFITSRKPWDPQNESCFNCDAVIKHGHIRNKFLDFSGA